MNLIREKFIHYAMEPGDIEEHMDTLYGYASQCETITELGVRFLVSTWSFLLAHPKNLLCIDIAHPSSYGEEGANNLKLAQLASTIEGIEFEFIVANDLDIVLPESDLIFIDTDHTYDQVSKELALHGDKAKKFLIFHDTNVEDMTKAIYEFLQDHPYTWRILEKKDNCNGLMVLGRIS